MGSIMQLTYSGSVDSDRASFKLEGTEILADGTNYVAVIAAQQAISNALNDIINGRLQRTVIGGNEFQLEPPVATNQYADNGSSTTDNKFVVIYKDTVTNRAYRQTMPLPDQSLFTGVTSNNGAISYELPKTSAEYTAFKTAWDNFVLRDGNATEITSVVLS